MKNFRFFQLFALALLVVAMVSCTAVREGYGYDEQPQRRSGAYHGNPRAYGNDVIIVERDPFTGRYYQVSPYNYYGSASPYYYNYPYNYNYGYNRGYNNNPRNYNYNTPRRSEQSAPDREKMNEARKKVLGDKN